MSDNPSPGTQRRLPADRQVQKIKRIIASIDRLNDWIGHGAAWLVLVMAVLTFLVVVLRYVFSLGWVWLQEMVLYLHAAFFMLAMGYTLSKQGHVRVDIFFRDMSEARKARVDFWGTVCLLYPVCILLIYFGLFYVSDSWLRWETSPEAGGLPLVFLLKTLILVMPLALATQGTSRMLEAWLVMRGVAPHDAGNAVHNAGQEPR
jgi:TRAP-type mannitol/chloroaromatic compound transport system permease small subunit